MSASRGLLLVTLYAAMPVLGALVWAALVLLVIHDPWLAVLSAFPVGWVSARAFIASAKWLRLL